MYSTATRDKAAVLTTAEMYAADRAAMARGTSSLALMEAAGLAVALGAIRHLPRQAPLLIACGPGNNGGDGFAAAWHLRRRGWTVRVALLGPLTAISPDSRYFAERWRRHGGPVVPLTVDGLTGVGGVIDALYGAGLSRPLEGEARAVVEAVNQRRIPCLAVDVPSGVNGNTGAILGDAPQCVGTVTFFRGKPGHFLYPARERTGHLTVADIGIPDAVLGVDIHATHFVNGPALWTLPSPGSHDHKYTRGHALILGGGAMTGAGRLAVRAARRAGAGLVTIAAPAAALGLYAADAPGALHAPLIEEGDYADLLADTRRNALLLGPGAGVSVVLTAHIADALATGRPTVLDADALTAFAGRPAALAALVRGPVVLTPHEGEFARLFGKTNPQPDRLTRTRQAAAESGCVVLLKGPDTVIAAPDGRVAITINAPPDLATGGSGDVLAGLIVGLLAQGMPAFEAAAAGAWLHGEAGRGAGAGLIAEDLPDILPAVLARLHGGQ